MPIPSRELVLRPNSPSFDTVDAFGNFNSPQLRNVRCEVLVIAGPGNFPSAVTPPFGYRAVVLGVGMETTTALAANRRLTFQMTRAGDGLGSADDALGVFNTVASPFNSESGAVPKSSFNILPPGTTLVSSIGNAGAAVWRVASNLAGGEAGNAYVFYWLFNAADIVTCP